MNKEKWVEKLKISLKGLPQKEIDDIIADYKEYFFDAINEGRTEEEITNSLGDPNKLGKQLKADSRIKTAEQNMNLKNVLKAIFAIVTLSLFNIIVMLGPITAILGMLFGVGVTGIALLAGGICAFFGTLLFGSAIMLGIGFSLSLPIALLLGVCLGSLGLIILILDFWLGKWTFTILVKYFRFNFELVKNSTI